MKQHSIPPCRRHPMQTAGGAGSALLLVTIVLASCQAPTGSISTPAKMWAGDEQRVTLTLDTPPRSVQLEWRVNGNNRSPFGTDIRKTPLASIGSDNLLYRHDSRHGAQPVLSVRATEAGVDGIIQASPIDVETGSARYLPLAVYDTSGQQTITFGLPSTIASGSEIWLLLQNTTANAAALPSLSGRTGLNAVASHNLGGFDGLDGLGSKYFASTTDPAIPGGADRPRKLPPTVVDLEREQQILVESGLGMLPRRMSAQSQTREPVRLALTDYSVGQSRTFDILTNSATNGYTPISAKLYVKNALVDTAFGSKSVRVWSTDLNNSGGVALSNATKIANSFLVSGRGNDIYDFVTGIHGEEYGAHGSSSYLSDADIADSIDIVLADIDNDGVPPQGQGRILGYFASYDLYRGSFASDSNQSLMFVIDEPWMTADFDGAGGTFQPLDGVPDSISTLAHEFSHMITFYRRSLLRNVQTSAFLDETLAMATEDLTWKGLNTANPTIAALPSRQKLYSVAATRIPDFIEASDYRLGYWASGLIPYSVHYALGAWLTRNFGGPAFINTIINSSSGSGMDAITQAITTQSNRPITVLAARRLWAAAVALSAYSNPGTGLNFGSNTDQVFTGTDGMSYRLEPLSFFTPSYGSFTYYTYSGSGGTIPSISYGSSGTAFQAGSTLWVRLGTGNPGSTVSFALNASAGTAVTAVVK